MPSNDDLLGWIGRLGDRLARGDLAGLGPIDLGDGTGSLPGETTVRIMLADLAHLDGLRPRARELLDVPERRRDLLDDFGRLRALIG